MKTPKELDILRRKDWFADTPDIVMDMKIKGYLIWGRHVHKMHIYQKHLIAEVRKLRKELKK